MIRRGALIGALALALPGLPLLWWIWPMAALDAFFAPAMCHALPLRDAETGREIVGIEDIARLPDGRFLLSAHDRLDEAGPDGGLYVFDPEELADEAPFVPRLTPALPADGLTGGLRPHGIAAHPELPLVAVINRGRDGNVRLLLANYDAMRQRLQISVEGAADPTLCSANDLVFRDLTLWITLDRGDCSPETLSELFGIDRSGLTVTLPVGSEGAEAALEASGLFFPNGVAIVPGFGPAVAETRGFRIRFLEAEAAPIPLGGGPDNLSLQPGDDPALIAALHPSLPRLGLYRYGLTERAPSRIVRISLSDGSVQILFNDPEGQVFPGATIGHFDGERLIAGSVRAPGLLVCGGL